MRKTILLCSLLFIAVLADAQKLPKTLDDLRPFIGLDCSRLEKLMKKKNYVYQGADNDDKKGPFTWKMYDADRDDDNWHDIYLICNDEKVLGVAFEDFTEADYSKILDDLKANGYKKTVNQKMIVRAGLERVDLWVSGDKKWQVKIDYKLMMNKQSLQEITLSTNEIGWNLD
jgi:hypothetical protein